MKKLCLLLVTLSVVALCESALADASGPRFADILFKGAQLYDGGGKPWVAEDVEVTGGHISFVGHADVAGVGGKEVIDARGLVLSGRNGDVRAASAFFCTSATGLKATIF